MYKSLIANFKHVFIQYLQQNNKFVARTICKFYLCLTNYSTHKTKQQKKKKKMVLRIKNKLIIIILSLYSLCAYDYNVYNNRIWHESVSVFVSGFEQTYFQFLVYCANFNNTAQWLCLTAYSHTPNIVIFRIHYLLLELNSYSNIYAIVIWKRLDKKLFTHVKSQVGKWFESITW